MVHKLIIIGSGPAGLTAAIYAGRGKLSPVLFEGEMPGGPLTTTSVVENYPGFPDGVDGTELIAKMRKQAERFGTEFVAKNADKVDFSSRPFKVFAGGKKYEAESVIIATGTTAKKLGIDSEKKFSARGISYCATCDGPIFKNKKVAVIGGGDSAMEEATFLLKFASEVTVIHRREELAASKIMQERAKKNKKIKWALNSEVEEFSGGNKLEKIILTDKKTGKKKELAVDGVFIAIGREPNTKIFDGAVKMEKGYILTDKGTGTSVPGVFSAGDVADWSYRQAIVAAGRGAMAAIEANRYLDEK
jgi:thioredoxin reductase (NADPH)